MGGVGQREAEAEAKRANFQHLCWVEGASVPLTHIPQAPNLGQQEDHLHVEKPGLPWVLRRPPNGESAI